MGLKASRNLPVNAKAPISFRFLCTYRGCLLFRNPPFCIFLPGIHETRSSFFDFSTFLPRFPAFLLKKAKTPHFCAVFLLCISFVNTSWWRRGESNSRPKTHPQELLRAQAVIAGARSPQFPFQTADRHAVRSGKLHDSWYAQSLTYARAPLNDARSRLVVLPGRTASF